MRIKLILVVVTFSHPDQTRRKTDPMTTTFPKEV
jgi:hypothetical protein